MNTYWEPHCEQILGADPDREEWLKARCSGIGSSDASAIVGATPYGSPLSVWFGKGDRAVVGPDDYPSLAARVGTFKEPLVADLFVEATGMSVSKIGLLRSKKWPFMLASCDRLVDCEPSILECKTTEARNAHEWAGDEVPNHALVQVIHQMAVTGLQRAYVAVLIGNSDFQVRTVDRNEAAISGLVDRVSAFWHAHVVAGVEPSVSQASDLQLIKDLRTPKTDAQVVATPELEQWLSERTRVGLQMADLKRQHDTLSGLIIQHLQGATAATSINGDIICTYTQVERGGYTVKPSTFRQLKLTPKGRTYVNG